MLNQVASYWKLHRFPILILILCTLFYGVFAYYLDRSDFTRLILLYGALFFFCFKLIQFEKWNFKFLLFAGLVFRIIFLFALPNLSQDFYRFIWDGELVASGMNPYLFSPDEIIAGAVSIPENGATLHENMGGLSARNYSNYPPLNQILFALATILGYKSILGSVISMRLIIILADIGVFIYGRKLLKNLNKSPHLIFWYFLNPLIIIELTGNLHFEGVMIFFFIAAMYLLTVNKWMVAAVLMAMSIQLKLIPLLFLPLFFRFFTWQKALVFYGIIGLGCVLIFLPFYSPEFTDHYLKTLGLWFSNFEFNAGIYNALKAIAAQFEIRPWNLIKSYGKITPFIVIVACMVLAFTRKRASLTSVLWAMLWVLSIFYFLSATVHPWYIIFLVILSLFTDYRYPLVWSALVFLSYSAYASEGYKEELWLIFIEYIVVFAFMFYEIFRLDGQKLKIQKN